MDYTGYAYKRELWSVLCSLSEVLLHTVGTLQPHVHYSIGGQGGDLTKLTGRIYNQ